MENKHEYFMQAAIDMAVKSVKSGLGGPFGAVVVKDGKIIAAEHNRVTANNDPTAHAEVSAIRAACKALGTFQLDECDIYTSCEPCPMCLGAIYWARPRRVYYGSTKTDAASIGFDDSFIYKELELKLDQRSIPMIQMMHQPAQKPFRMWSEMEEKIDY